MTKLTSEELENLLPDQLGNSKSYAIQSYEVLQQPQYNFKILYFGDRDILSQLSDQVMDAFCEALSETTCALLCINNFDVFGTSPQQQRFAEAIEACDAKKIQFQAPQPLEHNSFACMLGRLAGSKKDVIINVPSSGGPNRLIFNCAEGIDTLEHFPSEIRIEDNVIDISSQRQLAVRTARETQTEVDRQRITSCFSAVLAEAISAKHGLPMTTGSEEALSRRFQDNFTTKELATLRCVDRHTAGLPGPRNNHREREQDNSFSSLER